MEFKRVTYQQRSIKIFTILKVFVLIYLYVYDLQTNTSPQNNQYSFIPNVCYENLLYLETKIGESLKYSWFLGVEQIKGITLYHFLYKNHIVF